MTYSYDADHDALLVTFREDADYDDSEEIYPGFVIERSRIICARMIRGVEQFAFSRRNQRTSKSFLTMAQPAIERSALPKFTRDAGRFVKMM